MRKEGVDLRAVTNRALPLGTRDGELLLDFADAVLASGATALAAVQRRVLDELGPDALAGAAAVAGNFSRNDRIANAIGIPLERDFVVQAADLIATLGLERFASARNSL